MVTNEEFDHYVAWREFLLLDGTVGSADANGATHAGSSLGSEHVLSENLLSGWQARL